jgi:hypothetical protein
MPEWSQIPVLTVLPIRIWEPMLFLPPLDPGSGMNFVRIPDLGSWIFFTITGTKT